MSLSATIGGSYYTHNDRTGDKTVFIGSDHTDALKSTFDIVRSAPKRSGNRLGVRRAGFRSTKELDSELRDGTTELQPVKFTLSCDRPAGASNTDVEAVFIDFIKCLFIESAQSGVSSLVTAANLADVLGVIHSGDIEIA